MSFISLQTRIETLSMSRAKSHPRWFQFPAVALSLLLLALARSAPAAEVPPHLPIATDGLPAPLAAKVDEAKAAIWREGLKRFPAADELVRLINH